MSKTAVPAILGVDHLHVYVKNRELAERFYADVLGCHRVAKYAAWISPEGPLVVENREGTLHLALFERDSVQPSTVIALGATGEGWLQWVSHLTALGINVRTADHELSVSLYFEDLDSNGYEVTTYDRELILERAAL